MRPHSNTKKNLHRKSGLEGQETKIDKEKTYRVLACWISASSAFRESLKDFLISLPQISFLLLPFTINSHLPIAWFTFKKHTTRPLSPTIGKESTKGNPERKLKRWKVGEEWEWFLQRVSEWESHQMTPTHTLWLAFFSLGQHASCLVFASP